jgi:outer membrane lipoprotein-sorting protein
MLRHLRNLPLKSLCIVTLVLLLTGILVSGCIPSRTVQPEDRAVLPDTVIEALFDRVQESGQMFQSLQGLAKVQIVRQGKKTNMNQALQLEKPDRFRAETLNPFGFGSPLLLMAADGQSLAVMIPGEGRLFRGEASAGNLQRFTKLPLKIADLVHFLLYQIQVSPAQHQRGTLGPKGDYRLDLYDADGRRQELLFRTDMQLLETAYYQDDTLRLRVRYDNFTEGATPFPLFVQISMPEQQVKASLTFSEISTNLPLSAELFQLATPPGYEERPFP